MPGNDDHNQLDRIDEEMPDGASPQSIVNLHQEEAEFARVVAYFAERGMSRQLRTYLFRYSGPLPRPEIIKQYVELYPGAAEILFEGFKAEGEHRRSMETYALKHDVWQG